MTERNDNPSCPKCGHNNAMLGVEEDAQRVVRECRDCGHRVTSRPTFAACEDGPEWAEPWEA